MHANELVRTLAYCLHFATITKPSNILSIDRLQNTVVTASICLGKCFIKLPMTRFEPGSFAVEGDHSANCTTITAKEKRLKLFLFTVVVRQVLVKSSFKIKIEVSRLNLALKIHFYQKAF